jgi:hypothetical protein
MVMMSMRGFRFQERDDTASRQSSLSLDTVPVQCKRDEAHIAASWEGQVQADPPDKDDGEEPHAQER